MSLTLNYKGAVKISLLLITSLFELHLNQKSLSSYNLLEQKIFFLLFCQGTSSLFILLNRTVGPLTSCFFFLYLG